MAQLVKIIYDGYRDLMDNKSDPRTNDWPMMSSPFPTLAICLFYVYFVKALGPKLMENRKPFNLRKVMIYYNLIQVILSTWLFRESLTGWGGQYSFRCQPVDFSNNPMALRMARACWWYYISKLVDLMDTIFFVFRKKYDHISILHVIHHGSMPVFIWLGVKFIPGGHGTFLGFLNTFVHIIMYSYYLLAALGPQIQPYLWWKKYLTTLQMTQFILILIHALQLFVIDCDFPKIFTWVICTNATMYYLLFRNFYNKTYKKKNLKKASDKQKNDKKEENEHRDDIKENDNEKVIYANQYKMATGYISDSGLRNRVFIDNRGFDE